MLLTNYMLFLHAMISSLAISRHLDKTVVLVRALLKLKDGIRQSTY